MAHFDQRSQYVRTQYNADTIHITYRTWSELEEIPDETRRKLRLEYERQLASFPKNADLLVALALSYLDLGLYEYAVEYFQRAQRLNPRDPQTLYYLALTTLNGHRPKNQRLQTIQLIEQYLTAAMSLDASRSHVPLLAALIKHDYYLTNGLTPPGPSVQQLLSIAADGHWDPQEMRAIARFAALPPDVAQRFGLN